MTDDPCDNWPTAKIDGKYYLVTHISIGRTWTLARNDQKSTPDMIGASGEPINFFGVTDRDRAYRQARHRFLNDLYGTDRGYPVMK